MKFGSLFAGIGGFDLGLEQAGLECSWQVENNPTRIKVLQKHWPNIYRKTDVKECGKHNLSWVDLICGGFPCTDLSLCRFGSHSELQGPESSLVYHFARIANELKPTWIVIENVSHIKVYSKEIERIFPMWDIEFADLRASDFGAYTRRVRTFFIGYLRERGTRKILDKARVSKPTYQTRGNSDTLPMCLPWKGGLSFERLGSCLIEDKKTYTTGIREGNGISRPLDNIRYEMLGNAVCPPIAKWIGEQILGL